MPTVSLHIPQIGEGLQEARLVAILKKPGDHVRRDEPIYQMETDKAVMDVESPYEGTLKEWVVAVDTILPIGAEVAKMETSDATSAPPAPAAPSTPTGESEIPILIPQIGEGLQEARLVAVLKQPGDVIKRDEIIYQMETDKAVMDVESPHAGILVKWLAVVDTVLPIGAPVAMMRVEGDVPAPIAGHGAPAPTPMTSAGAAPSTASGPRRMDIPPRTRAYAKEKGLTEDQLATIAASGSKLMPADIDAYLSGGAPTAAKPTSTTNAAYEEKPLSQKQRLLSSRLVRGSQLVVPGTIVVPALWEPIEKERARIKSSGDSFQPSAFTMFAFAVAQALKKFPMFRSTMIGDGTLRTYHHADLGIAVALPGDELVLAAVEDADTLDWRGFAARTRERIDEARNGKDQARESVTVSLTNMQAYGLRDAVPVVVPPSVATLFLGEVFRALPNEGDDLTPRRYVNLSLTFDHRVINGVGAAEFINAIKANIEGIVDLLK